MSFACSPFDIGCRVERAYLPQGEDPPIAAPEPKIPYRLRIGFQVCGFRILTVKNSTTRSAVRGSGTKSAGNPPLPCSLRSPNMTSG